ncbi:MAG: fused MFS/spermidine synthase [Betaproteobacteria bacterium]|nr:fused MFS/spermidine synthase [Betaproteobacteria bacterium]
MPIYALTIFASAFLLFLVQPIMAKQILPWFGGSAAVWTTCLMFFQLVLLFGYAYADWTIRFLKPRPQVILHAALVVASLISLPIIAGSGWKPEGDEDPTGLILGLLAVTIGLPYFLLSTTGPLLQAWFARSYPATRNVYRLFALSNGASLIALVAYPFVVEPYITTREQSIGWSLGYALFALLCAVSAFVSLRPPKAAAPTPAGTIVADGPAPRTADYLLWLALAALGSFMLIAVTNHITHDVASVPFLWILPLTLYLLSFVLCFEGRNWYQRKIFFGPLLFVVAAMAWALHYEAGIMNIRYAIPLFSTGLFIMCMFFHGELAARKPAPRHLTGYYLMISLGGAIGGLMIGFVAPKLFNTYYEFGLGLVFTTLIAAYVARRLMPVMPALALLATGFTGFHVNQYVEMLSGNTRVMMRNFYGTLRVKDSGDETSAHGVRRLMHGVIMHGEQFLAPDRRMEPTTYYGPASGIGRLMTVKRDRTQPIRVGVVGLGTGTLATYGRAGDAYRFYEINPQVIELAGSEFSFLGSSQATVETLLGDARLTMEREPAQRYDVLAIDAFSSDSIPTHLMTYQAMGIYLKNLTADGVIAFHVTNRFLLLAPIVKRIADEYGLHTALVSDDPGDVSDFSSTEWVLVSRNAAALADRRIAEATSTISEIPGLRLWTDSFNNLFKILK